MLEFPPAHAPEGSHLCAFWSSEKELPLAKVWQGAGRGGSALPVTAGIVPTRRRPDAQWEGTSSHYPFTLCFKLVLQPYFIKKHHLSYFGGDPGLILSHWIIRFCRLMKGEANQSRFGHYANYEPSELAINSSAQSSWGGEETDTLVFHGFFFPSNIRLLSVLHSDRS